MGTPIKSKARSSSTGLRKPKGAKKIYLVKNGDRPILLFAYSEGDDDGEAEDASGDEVESDE